VVKKVNDHIKRLTLLVLQGEAYDNFINALKTKATKQLYIYALSKYMDFLKVEHVSDLISSTDSKLIASRIAAWVVHMRDVEKLAPITIKSFVPGVMKFYVMNDVVLNKEKIASYYPRDRKINDDRAFSRKEIATLLLECSGARERALVLLLASTGMRIEAVAELRFKHLIPIKIEQYSLYMIVVYQGDPDEYFCFTTPEAAQAIDYTKHTAKDGARKSPQNRH
jgi:integrase